MKRKICKLIIGDQIRYTVESKEHWWNRWHYLMDGQYPRLFSEEELIKFGISKQPEKRVLHIHVFDEEMIDRLMDIQKKGK